MSNYWAHTENAENKPHLLHDHLHSVGQLASQFAAQMNPQLCEAAQWAGRLHDLGKYRDEFQDYLRGKRESSEETHHAIYGAALTFQQRCIGPTLAIAGHHAGLHDWHQLAEELKADTKYQAQAQLPLIRERFAAELGELVAKITEPDFIRTEKLSAELYVRMLFSALVDADFLDTEAHHKLAPRPVQSLQPGELLQRIIAEKESKPRDGELNELRNRIFQQCLDAAQAEPGFFSLTVPTGGGKTIAGMAFALAHAQRHELRRVIVVIPYLSIIEQNAAQYRRMLDPEKRGVVIENHSAITPPEDAGETRPRKPFEKHPTEYAAENWDAPVIVTTSVQFIESLFANRTSRCRKLHNVARSVVIFDEVQTLPPHLLNPLLNVLRELRDHYGVSFVFSTATQPAFRHRPRHLEEGFKPDEVREITTGTAETFRKLQRVRYSLPEIGRTTSWMEVAGNLAARQQSLCVVNLRRHAYELWEQLRQTLPAADRDGLFHLSSAMCAQHRFDLLGDSDNPQPGTIRHRLRHHLPCRLVSTQLIEAGVDVDFPIVYRALGPLDSIVQAAGRCNREGRLTDAGGQPAFGQVVVFQPEEHKLPPGVYSMATDITATLLMRTKADDLAQNHELFGEYFDQLCQLTETDKEKIQDDRKELKYREVASKARVISNDTKPVIVPYGNGEEIINAIRTRRVEKGQPRFTRADLRRLQRYIVNLYSHQFRQLEALKQVSPLLPNLDLHVLSAGLYHKHLGLVINQRPLEDFNL
ncbi:MAG: CRISPR-associated endonuclease Cas3'' [Acidobacteriota bacterium]